METLTAGGDRHPGLNPGETGIPDGPVDGDAQEAVAVAWDRLWWPQRPYATDRFAEGIYRFPRPIAKGKRYVEANPTGVSNLLVVDVDHPDSALRAISANGSHPMPNVIVENPGNGHAHAIWALQEPVTRTEYARRKPLAYATAVTEGLRRAVDGDKGYSGLMMKNPIHQAWNPHLIHTDLHELSQLEAALGRHMPPPRWRESRHYDPAGLGRNCCLFDGARVWAYRELRHHFGNPTSLHTAITTHIHQRNTTFTEPLPHTETRAITTSIHTWITTKSRMWKNGLATYNKTFTTIQKKRGTKSGEARESRREDRLETIRKETLNDIQT